MNRLLLVPLLLSAVALTGCPPPKGDSAPTTEAPPAEAPPVAEAPPATNTNEVASLPQVTYYALKG